MSCLTTWTADTQADCLDLNRLVDVISEIDDKLDNILARLTAVEAAVVDLTVAHNELAARVTALENP
jgi:hypothetical protein